MGERGEKTLRLKEKTARSFGFEWERFSDIYTEYEANFLSYICPLNKDFFRGKLVLDAGCGAGRHAYFAAKFGAKVVAFDLSEKAAEAARRNTEKLLVQVEQADIYALPLEWRGRFDYVFCIGVLHHLPDPQAGFEKLVDCVRIGGTISVWVYGKKDNRLATQLYEPVRRITTKLNHRLLYYLVLPLAVMMEVTNRLRLPWFAHYRKFPFRTKWNDAFDVFSAPSARYYTLHDIERWFDDAGLRRVRIKHRMLEGKAKGIIGMGVKL